VLDAVSLAIILGAALLVSGAVSYSAVRELRAESPDSRAVTAD
jgi:ABC-type enterobactin transport system permease subunit